MTRHVAKLKPRVEGDSSLMTYTGHTILQTLIRCSKTLISEIYIPSQDPEFTKKKDLGIPT